MSGIEVAGLALGAFPLLLEGAKGLRKQLEKFEFLANFRNKFDDFHQEIEREHITYDQILRILLGFLDLAPDEQKGLVDAGDRQISVLWGAYDIDTQLQLRFKKNEFEWLTSQIQRVNEALERLRGLLAGQKVVEPRPLDTDLESEWKKIKTSLFSEKDEALARVAQGNKHISDFLDRASRIGPSRHSDSQVQTPLQKQWRHLKSIQKQAKLLHTCLQKHWSCNCKAGHPGGVTIQKVGKASKDDLNIVIMFCSLSQAGHLRLRVEVEDSTSVLAEQIQVTAKAESSKRAEVTRLTQQVAAKNSRKRASKNNGSLSKLVESSTTALLAALPEAMKEHRDEMERRPKRLKKTPILKSTGASSSTSGVAVPDAAKEVSSFTSSSLNTGPRTRSKVRFHVTGDEPPSQPVSHSEVEAKTAPIENLCLSVTCGPRQSCLGFLDGDDRTRVYLHVEAATQTTNPNKLERLDFTTKSEVSRPERLQIALTTAFLVGGLGESPWLKPDWTSEDVCLWTDPESSTHQPYLLHNSLLSTLRKAPKSQGRTNLYLLGIVLLELVFGEKLEDQPIRHKYLGEDGSPNELTDFCTAVEWKTKARQEVGFLIADGIGWCLGCLHGPQQDIGSPECLKNLWQNVILPLESFLKQWFEDPVS